MTTRHITHTSIRSCGASAAFAALCLSLLGSAPARAQNANDLPPLMPAPVFTKHAVKPAVPDAAGRQAHPEQRTALERAADPAAGLKELPPIIVAKHPITAPVRKSIALALA